MKLKVVLQLQDDVDKELGNLDQCNVAEDKVSIAFA
jgi:hypothetical protein